MTLAQLHEIKDFGALFDDPRFKALIQYLRANPRPKSNSAVSDATLIIRSEGAWHGWFDCIEAALGTARGPVQPNEVQRGQPYSKPEPK